MIHLGFRGVWCAPAASAYRTIPPGALMRPREAHRVARRPAADATRASTAQRCREPMSISQADIDALLGAAADHDAQAQPDASAAPHASTSTATRAAPHMPAQPGPPPSASPAQTNATPAELRRILDLYVPVSVTLAEKQMTVKEVLEITVGTIVEFEQNFDSDLVLNVGGRPVGNGEAVKCGEKFGLRVRRIDGMHERVDAMGGR